MRYAILKLKDHPVILNVDIWFLVNRTSSDNTWEIEYTGDSEIGVSKLVIKGEPINSRHYSYDDSWDYRECTKDEWEQELYLLNL
jgi:hypothetical protein